VEEKFGLKRWHLSKFSKSVDRFYRENIDKAPSHCELIARYQKRFQRYRDSLFTFLELDGTPWHNNTAENVIRHLAVQRKISGTFFKKVAPQAAILILIFNRFGLPAASHGCYAIRRSPPSAGGSRMEPWAFEHLVQALDHQFASLPDGRKGKHTP
jgi:hypothetical protein